MSLLRAVQAILVVCGASLWTAPAASQIAGAETPLSEQTFDAGAPEFIGQIREAAWQALTEEGAPAAVLLQRRFQALSERYPGISFVDYKDGTHRLMWTYMQRNGTNGHRLPSLREVEVFLDRVDAAEIKYYSPAAGSACAKLGQRFGSGQ